MLWTINPKPGGNRNQEQFGAFRLSVVRSKPKQLQQPIIARKYQQGTNENESETSKLPEAREKRESPKARLVLVLNLIG